jgi:hypothetical protein
VIESESGVPSIVDLGAGMTTKKRHAKKSSARPRTFEEVRAANLADPFHAARIARLNMGERFDDPNGPSDDRWAREVFVHPDCEGGSPWMVDWGELDGGCYTTTFDGSMAEQRGARLLRRPQGRTAESRARDLMTRRKGEITGHQNERDFQSEEPETPQRGRHSEHQESFACSLHRAASALNQKIPI